MPQPVTKVSIALQLCVPVKAITDKNNYYVCKVNGCNSTLSASNTSNIRAHMESQHAEIFKKRYNDAVLSSKTNAEELETRRLEFIQNLTETVTINGRPLAHLYDSGMRKLH